MATDVQQDNATQQPSVSSLVVGIVNDTQELIKQHLELFRTEVKEDFTKTKQAVIPLIIGVVVMGVGALLVCFTLVYLLHWAASPHLQLWAPNLLFDYESTGSETLFRDLRDPHPRSRRLFAFHKPGALFESLKSGSVVPLQQ